MLVSTDLSFGMLRLAGEKLKARGTRDRVHLAVADSTRLGWLRSQRFDVAVSYALLHHLEQPEPVWAGLDRIMREHAHVLVQDNNASGMRTMFDWLMSRRELWEAEHPDHPVIQLTDLHRWATQHGFEINARTSVFVPPHVCNSLSVRAARRLLASTDGVMSRVPIAARHGGLILAEAFRGGPPLVMGAQPRTLTYS